MKMFIYLDGTPYNWIIWHSDSQWMLSKAFLKIDAIDYERTFPSRSQLALPLRCKVFCRTLQNTLPGMDSSVMPRQLLQSPRFPFLGSVTTTPRLQSAGISLLCQIMSNKRVRLSTTTSWPCLNNSADIIKSCLVGLEALDCSGNFGPRYLIWSNTQGWSWWFLAMPEECRRCWLVKNLS